jgi:hypothetical protein
MCRLGNGSGGVFAPAAIEWKGEDEGDGRRPLRPAPPGFGRGNILSMIEISGLE